MTPAKRRLALAFVLGGALAMVLSTVPTPTANSRFRGPWASRPETTRHFITAAMEPVPTGTFSGLAALDVQMVAARRRQAPASPATPAAAAATPATTQAVVAPPPPPPPPAPALTVPYRTVWLQVHVCEALPWTYVGTAHSGGLGFANSTWAGDGGLQFAPTAGEATPTEQMYVASRIQPTPPYWDTPTGGCHGW